jgi:proteic killer suppression protein
MNITFQNKWLEKIVNNDRLLIREFGQPRADKIRLRLTQLNDALTLEDVRYLSGNYHELTHTRKGQWACDLDQPYRLIFEPHERPIPTDKHGSYVWIEVSGVEIIEIINYHKEK